MSLHFLGGKRMATRNAFPVRLPSMLATLLCVIFFFTNAQSQHGGGGGGHSGGGHSGGGHSSGGHSSATHASGSHTGHFGWLHFGRSRHSGGRGESGASASSVSPLASELWNLSSRMRVRPVPPTLVWTPSLFPSREGRISFAPSAVPPRHPFAHHHFHRHSPSGCFFDGATQVCFFEPLFPLLYCSGGFGFYDYGYGAPVDYSDSLNSQGLSSPEMTAFPPANPSDENAGQGSSPAEPASALAIEAQGLDQGVFLLVLSNGATHAVTDYWVADGYLEYVSPDGTRSHIPLEALDLERTVTANSPRGLPFVLRSAPAQNR
jgi:hypothetical protein